MDAHTDSRKRVGYAVAHSEAGEVARASVTIIFPSEIKSGKAQAHRWRTSPERVEENEGKNGTSPKWAGS